MLLQTMAEVPEEPLRRGLAHLQAAEFLYETRLFPDIEYTFKHALTQQVAYETLLQERRRTLHTRIVESLEALAGDGVPEQVERLAHHALRGDVWAKALAYCRQAGEKAMARSAHREAVGYFEQALSALAHLPETRDRREQAIDLRLALRSALFPSGDSERIVTYLRQAETLAAALNDPRRLGQIAGFLSAHFRNRGAYDQSIAAAQRALTLATADQDVVLQALVNQNLGAAYWAQGDYLRAIDCLGQTAMSFSGAQRHERFGGIDPVRDQVYIGPVPTASDAGVSFGVTAARALEAGTLDGFWANAMGAEVAVRRGVGTVVLDVRRGDGPPAARGYTFPALVTTEQYMTQEPDSVAAAVRAIVKTQRALRHHPERATEVGRRLFPEAEAALIAELIRRDLPYYDPGISLESVTSLNRFAQDIGLLPAPVPYTQVVATDFASLWSA